MAYLPKIEAALFLGLKVETLQYLSNTMSVNMVSHEHR